MFIIYRVVLQVNDYRPAVQHFNCNRETLQQFMHSYAGTIAAKGAACCAPPINAEQFAQLCACGQLCISAEAMHWHIEMKPAPNLW